MIKLTKEPVEYVQYAVLDNYFSRYVVTVSSRNRKLIQMGELLTSNRYGKIVRSKTRKGAKFFAVENQVGNKVVVRNL